MAHYIDLHIYNFSTTLHSDGENSMMRLVQRQSQKTLSNFVWFLHSIDTDVGRTRANYRPQTTRLRSNIAIIEYRINTYILNSHPCVFVCARDFPKCEMSSTFRKAHVVSSKTVIVFSGFLSTEAAG